MATPIAPALPALPPLPPAGPGIIVAGHHNLGAVCLAAFNTIHASHAYFDRIRKIVGGGWEGWLQVELAALIPINAQLPQAAGQQVDALREQPIYKGAEMVDLWVEDKRLGTNAGIELKCKQLDMDEDSFITEFTRDFGDKVHDGPSGGPKPNLRGGKTILWGIGFLDNPNTAKRIIGQLAGMHQEYVALGYCQAGPPGTPPMYMVWYCQWYA
ncbi:hypothetical protein FQN51_000737 [Onygenales sp. PD_10]|nr:hypothetical protein FQN51_000737 [Onygenales sp. PD_10]